MTQPHKHRPDTPFAHRYRQARIVNDAEWQSSTLYMQPPFRPCFTLELLEDIAAWQRDVARQVRAELDSGGPASIRYAVLASSVPRFFNVGGDLHRFIDLIRERDRGGLLTYATACVDVAYRASVNFDVPLTTIALVQGNALGGGFEAALSASVIIAERDAQMGFPEVLFNLFPGMGAYSFLSRRVAPALAERIILSGDLYSAESLYEMGVVTHLAEPGQGEQALRDFIRQADRRSHAQALIHATRTRINRVPYEELLEIATLWVDCALGLSDRELKTMERLVRAQSRSSSADGKGRLLAGDEVTAVRPIAG